MNRNNHSVLEHLFVINAGSSSIKYSMYEVENLHLVLQGEITGLGSHNSHHHVEIYPKQISTPVVIDEPTQFDNHQHGVKTLITDLSRYQEQLGTINLKAMSHRFVHGGDVFSQPTLVDQYVITQLKTLTHLAPLHNPTNIAVIEQCYEQFPTLKHYVVFDTAFHQTLPDYAYRYALPTSYYTDFGIRRYGFHGLSHHYVAERAAHLLDKPINEVNLISLHLGNGASICAIKKGKSINTSMGFTPLEGLVMGSRCGDMDPSIPLYLQQHTELSIDQVEHQLNYESGLMALADSNNVSDLLVREHQGDTDAALALNIFVHQIRKYIGAYLIELGHVDGIIFTAGIGEHVTEIRQRCCAHLDNFGISLDQHKNSQCQQSEASISSDESHITVMVIPTNEAYQMAKLINQYF
jgi:acetate kinase